MIKVWLVEYKDIDPWAGDRTVYAKKEDAFKAVSGSIAGWASEELEEHKRYGDRQEEHVDALKEVVKAVAAGKHEDAYNHWREYADDAQPDQDLLVDELDLIEDSRGGATGY